jgi:hypothetical protein
MIELPLAILLWMLVVLLVPIFIGTIGGLVYILIKDK